MKMLTTRIMLYLDHAYQKSIRHSNDSFSITSQSLRNYYRDKVNDSANEADDKDNTINNNKTTKSKSFKYKTRTIGSSSNNNSRLNAEVVAPLKYLSNFRRSIDLSMINCETELDLTWSKHFVLSEEEHLDKLMKMLINLRMK